MVGKKNQTNSWKLCTACLGAGSEAVMHTTTVISVSHEILGILISHYQSSIIVCPLLAATPPISILLHSTNSQTGSGQLRINSAEIA